MRENWISGICWHDDQCLITLLTVMWLVSNSCSNILEMTNDESTNHRWQYVKYWGGYDTRRLLKLKHSTCCNWMYLRRSEISDYLNVVSSYSLLVTITITEHNRSDCRLTDWLIDWLTQHLRLSHTVITHSSPL